MLAIVLSAVLLAMVVMCLRWCSAPPKVREPRCAHCGYDVRGLSRGVCPECGSDLTSADAVLVPELHASQGLPARMVAWSVMLALLGMMACALASEMTSSLKQRQSWFVTLRGPAEFGYRSLDVRISDTAWRESDLQPRHGTITLTRLDGSTAQLNLDRIARTVTAATGAGSAVGASTAQRPLPNTAALEDATLRSWLVAHGAAGTPGQLDYQARALHAAVAGLSIDDVMNVPAHDDWTPVGGGRRLALFGGGSGGGAGPALAPAHAVRITQAVFLGLWVLGCVVIVRRARWRAAVFH